MANNPTQKSSTDTSNSSNIGSSTSMKNSSSHLSSASNPSSSSSPSSSKVSSSKDFSGDSLKDNLKDTLSTDDLSLNSGKENVSNITSDFRNRASTMASDVSERASGYYEDASEWISENRSTLYTVVGVLAFTGLAFFAFTKRDSIRESFRDRRAS